METSGQKRVMSFEEFMEKGQGAEMDAMPSQEDPMMIQGEDPMGQDSNIDLEKEPQPDDTDLAMMDEPSDETPAEDENEMPQGEESTTDESTEFWGMD